tara:strand:+ start:2735 stop:3175 length:441 start_codon:yes stop_codon:yes gene_type:complete
MGEIPELEHGLEPRLDTDEDRSAVLWYSAGRRAADDAASSTNSQNIAAPEIAVDVLLFGLLSAVTTESPVSLSLAGTATPMDVVAALEDRFGAEPFAQIKDPGVGILPCCRLFVDGEPFEDVDAPISPDGKSATVEMIILKGFEGG